MIITISNPTFLKLSSKTKRRLKHEVHQCLGTNICRLQKFIIQNEENSKLNRYAIYTKQEGQDPREMFKEAIVWGKNYLFGYIELRRTKEKIFYLIDDIEEPLHISDDNKIIEFTKQKEKKKIIIHIK